MEGFLIQEVALKGIVKTRRRRTGIASRRGYIAIFLGTDGKSYFVTTGQRLFDGVITAVDATSVSFRQEVTDPLSPVKTRDIEEEPLCDRGGEAMRAKLAGVGLGAIVLAALGAGTAPAQDKAPTAISDIRQESTERSTRLIVVCTGPLAYTYYSPDPLTLVVDIPEVDASKVPARINVGTREVESLRVTSLARADGRSLARLEVRLASLVPYQIYSKGTRPEPGVRAAGRPRARRPQGAGAHGRQPRGAAGRDRRPAASSAGRGPARARARGGRRRDARGSAGVEQAERRPRSPRRSAAKATQIVAVSAGRGGGQLAGRGAAPTAT